jgi:hypothetical protein
MSGAERSVKTERKEVTENGQHISDAKKEAPG